jgi:hypothetical protein
MPAAVAAASTPPAGLIGHPSDGSLHDTYEDVRPVRELLQRADSSQQQQSSVPGWQYNHQLHMAEQQQLDGQRHAEYYHQQQPHCSSAYAEQAGAATAAAASGLAANPAGYKHGGSGNTSSRQQPSAVIIDDLQLDSDEEEQQQQQQQQAEQVEPFVPLDMPAGACRILVSLPRFAPFAVQRSFSSLQLPASYLLQALSSSLQASCKQQQQGWQSPGATAQLLLPSCGCSCSVDLQLVAVAVEQHPQGSAWGAVGLVQRVSNVLQGAALLHAEQHGASYRYAAIVIDLNVWLALVLFCRFVHLLMCLRRCSVRAAIDACFLQPGCLQAVCSHASYPALLADACSCICCCCMCGDAFAEHVLCCCCHYCALLQSFT